MAQMPKKVVIAQLTPEYKKCVGCNLQLTVNVVAAYLLQFWRCPYTAQSVGHCFPNDRLLPKGGVYEQSKWGAQVY